VPQLIAEGKANEETAAGYPHGSRLRSGLGSGRGELKPHPLGKQPRSLISLAVTPIVIGVLRWLVNTCILMDSKTETILGTGPAPARRPAELPIRSAAPQAGLAASKRFINSSVKTS
jgi:hypothetical protein